MEIRIFKIIKQTKVEGPGLRYCIWVQGCSKHCDGCYATNTWNKNGGKIFDTQDIIKEIQKQKKVEGVTFLGGEPFEQAEALSEIAKEVKKVGLSILTFTGNLYEDLKNSKDKNILNLLKYTDILIDGGFEKDKFDLSRPWVGSKNQRYIFLSDFYCEDDIKNYKNKIEVRIAEDGKISMNGMGDFKKLEQHLTQNEFLKVK